MVRRLPAKRKQASAIRVNDAARTGAMKAWTCDICGDTGEQPTMKTRTAAFDHHYFTRHFKEVG
jgi:hypothetical protein